MSIQAFGSFCRKKKRPHSSNDRACSKRHKKIEFGVPSDDDDDDVAPNVEPTNKADESRLFKMKKRLAPSKLTTMTTTTTPNKPALEKKKTKVTTPHL